MKKKILQLALITLPLLGYSQIGGSVVYDPTQATNMATQIQNTTKQISQLDKSLELMKKASDKLEKVNGALRNLEELNKLKRIYVKTVRLSSQLRAGIPKIKDPNRRKSVIKELSKTLATIQTSLTFINKVLSNNFFSMSDKERLDLIRETETDLLIQKAGIVSMLYGF